MGFLECNVSIDGKDDATLLLVDGKTERVVRNKVPDFFSGPVKVERKVFRRLHDLDVSCSVVVLLQPEADVVRLEDVLPQPSVELSPRANGYACFEKFSVELFCSRISLIAPLLNSL